MKHLPRDISKLFADRQLVVDRKFKADLKKSLLMEGSNMASKNKKSSILETLRKQKLALPVGAALAVLVIAGGAFALVGNNSRSQLSHEQNTVLPEDLSAALPVEQIRTLALQDLPGGSIVSVELETEEGVLVYKVKFSDGTVRIYDAKTGVVFVKPAETDDLNDDQGSDDGQDDDASDDSGDDSNDDSSDDSSDDSTDDQSDDSNDDSSDHDSGSDSLDD